MNRAVPQSEKQTGQLTEWWRGAVIYQIYPRSLKDSNGDGVGDLPGIIEKLDYIAGLGVDAIWISPFFKSPMQDFGYDISDYREIDPLFGTLEDFDRLVLKAHSLGLKVMIDQILSHTSDQHAWFEESRSNRDNPKADWYVWADPKKDGTPPNNWLSIFGGCAWQWDSRRCQYYLHNFLASQPDLNFHNRDVRRQILEEVEFWLKRGVDGVRLDAINFCFHDRLLRDNPAKPAAMRDGRGFSRNNPYAYQYHYFNNTQPENIEFIEELRALLNKYPGAAALGEVSSEDSLQTMADYTRGNKRLHMAYSFELLVDTFCTAHIRKVIEKSESILDDGSVCWAIGNHDVARVVSRWGAHADQQVFARLVIAFLMSLKGTLCVYQGEELGLTEVALPRDQLKDPYGIAFWPEFQGRDGCRTPFPWDHNDLNAGFTTGQPWLPMPEEHLACSVNTQLSSERSTLNVFKKLLAWRKANPVLTFGNIEFIDSPDGTLIFWRYLGDEQILAAFNFTDTAISMALQTPEIQPIHLTGFDSAIVGNNLELPGMSAFFGKTVSGL